MTLRPPDDDPDLMLEPSDEELAESERLARALDERSERNAPQDALEAGLLLRVLEDRGLAPEREDAILQEVLAKAPRANPKRRRHLGWSLLWAGLGLTALGVVVVIDQGAVGDAPPLSAGLPEPSLELLQAQASGLGGGADPAYQTAMADYRREVLSSLRGGSR